MNIQSDVYKKIRDKIRDKKISENVYAHIASKLSYTVEHDSNFSEFFQLTITITSQILAKIRD